MNMRYEDFWFNYDLRELYNAIEGYYERENNRNREGWEQTRIICTFIQNKPVWGYKIKYNDPKKIFPLPWDDEDSGLPDEDLIKKLRKETWGQEQ